MSPTDPTIDLAESARDGGDPPPVDVPRLTAELRGTLVGRRIVWLPTTTSTNDAAWGELRQGGDEGVCVLADAQTAGRGRFGRGWYSPPGVGLWMSVALTPDLPVERAPYLVPLGALAVCDAIAALLAESPVAKSAAVGIRWPNDVVSSGRKLAGVLVESRDLDVAAPAAARSESRGRGRRGYVVGLGVNVNQVPRDFPADLAGSAESLRVIAGRVLDRTRVAALVLRALDRWYQTLCGGDHDAVAAAWRSRSALVGRRVRIRSGGQVFTGRALDLDPCDGIVVQLDSDANRWFRTEHVEKLEVLEYR